MCSIIELRYDKMEKWNHIFEWSKRVKVHLDEENASSLEKEHPVVRRVVERLRKPGYLQGKGKEQGRFDAKAAFRKLRKRNRHRLVVRVGMAAASVVILLGSFWLVRENMEMKERMPLAKQEIIPGVRKAVLLLEDGRKFELKDSLPVKIETEKGVIRVDSTGVVLGTVVEDGERGEEGYNTLSIPRGGEYHLILSDGTSVWLNSETELCFPMQFKGASRQVYLKGEAYFDVKSNPRKPFIVKTSAGNVKVLGTAFDVMIYDTTRLVATLERGAISYAGNLQPEVVLRPGEQLTHSVRNNQVRVEKVNTRIYTAWKDNLFCFEEQRLDEIMVVLARWYNLEVRFEVEELKGVELSGTLDKYSDVGLLLKFFELGTNVKFDVQGNIVIVRKAK